MTWRETFWYGTRARCRRVRAVIGSPPSPHYWTRNMVGQERDVVEVRHMGRTFYLDNTDGSGWDKVTLGGGNKLIGHRLVPVEAIRD